MGQTTKYMKNITKWTRIFFKEINKKSAWTGLQKAMGLPHAITMLTPTQLNAEDCVAVFRHAIFVSYYTIQKLPQSRSCSKTQESWQHDYPAALYGNDNDKWFKRRQQMGYTLRRVTQAGWCSITALDVWSVHCAGWWGITALDVWSVHCAGWWGITALDVWSVHCTGWWGITALDV